MSEIRPAGTRSLEETAKEVQKELEKRNSK